MSNTEYFINMKSIPDPESVEYEAFFDYETQKIDNGVTIAGCKIPGWLYWHTNHWSITYDKKLDNNRVDRIRETPVIRDSEWILAEAYQRAQEEQKGLMIIGTRRFGKELLNSSKLYQVGGEKAIGDAKVGDLIYGANGQLTKITGVFPQGIKPIYQITLRNGTKLYAGLEHNWFVYDKDKSKYVVKTTADLLKGYKRPRIHNGYKDKQTRVLNESRYFIPINGCVDYPSSFELLDPYLLGLWLGDGNSANLGITTVDKEIIDYLYHVAEVNGLSIYVDEESTYLLTTGAKGGPNDKNALWNEFKKHGLPGNKHIPKSFHYTHMFQRLQLLQGLMDSDGYCSESGAISFCNKNKRLIDDVYQLCRSLGISCRIRQKKCGYKKDKVRVDCGIAYEIQMFTSLPVFKLDRKLNRIRSASSRSIRDAIVDIQYVYDAGATCIMVDSEDHLFLTDDYTVTHNSEFAASLLARNATIYKNSENVLTGGNSQDIAVIAGKCETGLVNLHPYYRHPRIAQNWLKEIKFGYKEKKSGRPIEFSRIIIRNFKNGDDTEAAAGTTASTFIMDEIGKFPFLECYAAARPSFSTPFGWRCIPILTGTGGAFEKGDDAQRMFWEPESFNFLAVDLDGGRKSGIFVPGYLSIDVPKKRQTLASYLSVTEPSELDDIPIDVANQEEGEKILDKMREDARKSSDPKALLKAKMYYPKTPDECFLTSGGNNFPVEAAQQHLNHLRTLQMEGTLIHLYRDANGVIQRKFAESHERPISEFPVKPDTIKTAPIQIFEFPEPNAPYGLYVAGADPYNQASADSSESLGSVYIYKRSSDIIGDGYQDMLVAVYTARPMLMDTWHKNVEMLLEFYNAVCMPENEGYTMIQWFANQNKSHLLADGMNFLKEISPTTTIARAKGLPATPKVIAHCMNLAVEYCNERIQVGVNEFTQEPIYRLGITRILDPMLLEEIIKYNETGNFDRIVAWRHALAYADYLDRWFPIVKVKVLEKEPVREKPIPKSPFYNQRKGTMKGGSPFIRL